MKFKTFTDKSTGVTMKRSALFSTVIFLFFLCLMSLSGCEKKVDCKGCDKEAPWSTPESNYCYPTKGQCQDVEGEDCQKCN